MSQRKLLLADDSITIQKVVNLTFADEGIEVITVSDGDSALERMEQSTPDLVMADVSMPGLNGYQLCERIRQTDTLKKTPVILLVGSFEPYDENEAARVGANDFLTKPFQSIRQLVTKVTELLDSSTSAATTQNEESSFAVTSPDYENANTIRNLDAADEYSTQVNSSSGNDFNYNSAPYGNAEMDDELIQTNSASNFSMDESAKFETKEVAEPEFDAKTQPLSAADLREFSFSNPPSDTEGSAQNVSNEQHFDQPGDYQAEEPASEISSYSQSSAGLKMSDEDDDLLELPFDEEDWEDEEEAAETSVSSTAAETSNQNAFVNAETESPSAESETADFVSNTTTESISAYQQNAAANEIATEETTSATENFPAQLSPEMIEAIAQRVVEKLSEKAVKDIAWEVVPQMADLIIRKMTEERLKQ